jgi:glycosyltransferase involved in cell wall biosynthesis
LRVLLLGDYPPAPTGGATVNYFLARHLADAGFDVCVHTHLAGAPKEYGDSGVKVLGGMLGRFTPRYVKRVIDDVKPDVALLSGTWFLWDGALPAVLAAKLPFVAYLTCEGPVEPERLSGMQLASSVFAPSSYAAGFLEEALMREVEVLPHCVDPSFFFDDNAEPDPRLVYCPARWDDERKQVGLLYAALQALRAKGVEAKLMVGGRPPWGEPWVQPTWRSQGASSAPPLAEVAKLYSKAGVVAFLGGAEGFGMPVLESMAAGRPCICLDAPPMNELHPDPDLRVKVAYVRFARLRVVMGWREVQPSVYMHVADAASLEARLRYALEGWGELMEREEAWRREAAKYGLRGYDALVKALEGSSWAG